MADSVIAAFLNKLGYMLLAEADSLHEVEDELWLLHSMLTRLMPFPLMEVEKKESEANKAIQVITLVLEAEDVTDSYLNTVRKGNYSSTSTLMNEAQIFRSQIKGMIESLKKLHAWSHRYTESSTCGISSSTSTKRPPPIEDGNDDAVLVQEDEVKRMIDLLKDDKDSGCGRTIIPVVGHGGIGKTTFVRKVYENPTIVEHFPCRSWVYVSSDYKVEELLLDIMKQIKPTTAPTEEMKNLRNLATETYKHLKHSTTRYLIVFDDVCEAQFWADIKMVFPANKKSGSRIIFTTRHNEVAALLARPNRPPFYLRRLSKEESRTLFSKRLVDFHSHSSVEPIDIHHPWQEWVDATGGLPLAIVELAAEYDHRHRLLQSAAATDDEKKDEESKSGSDIALPPGICELIYNSLPPHLKMCLAYCRCLQEKEKGKGFLFFEYKGLLVAEGLIKPTLPSGVKIQSQDHQASSSAAGAASAEKVEEVEDIAEEYLNELINMNSIIEVRRRSFDGCIKAIAIPREYYSLSDIIAGQEYRPLSGFSKFSEVNRRLEEVRSLFVNYSSETTTLPELERILQDSASSLRVLDSIKFNYNPGTINLIHLRYLRLYFTSFVNEKARDFINCLSDLWNLQFLKIKFPYDDKYCQFSLQFWKMRQLRHLSFRRPSLDPSFMAITEKEVMNRNSDHVHVHHGCNIPFLNNLQTLDGLNPQFFCAVNDWSMLTNLVTLRLHGEIFRSDDRLARVFPLLERLRRLRLDGYKEYNATCKLEIFPPNITHLSLTHTYFGKGYLGRALRKLHNLYVLKLGWRAIRPNDDLDFGNHVDDGFRQLKFLKLKQMVELRKWNLSMGVMPSLQKVAVIFCRQLEGLPSPALEAIPTLQELEVSQCSNRVVTEARLIEERVGKNRPLKLSIS